uniref:Uncharacterized protein n=1 Tax=Romanomermis culicivorax TaxID=13658 RepID=A0A915KBF7_ROMCU
MLNHKARSPSAENPELTWNDEIRSKIQNSVKLIKHEIVDVQSKILDFQWVVRVPEDFKCLYEHGGQFSADFIQIGGVNLNLFVKNPSWVLRNPRKFASQLIETILHDFEKSANNDDKSDYQLKIMLSALIGLFENQPHLTEMMASQGYAQKVCGDLLNDDIRKIGCEMEILNLLQQIFKNEFERVFDI